MNVGFKVFTEEDAETKKLNEAQRTKKAARLEQAHGDEKRLEEVEKTEREEMYEFSLYFCAILYSFFLIQNCGSSLQEDLHLGKSQLHCSCPRWNQAFAS